MQGLALAPAWISWGPDGITFAVAEQRRRCAFPDCITVLRRSNDGSLCGVHERTTREAW